MLRRRQRAALDRVIALANYKGGVGKTTTTANLASFFARDGHRVLAIDLDDQNNLSTMFGYGDTEIDDEGAAVLQSFVDGEPFAPTPVPGAEGIDVLAGGEHTAELERFMVDADIETAERFAVLLSDIASEYDVVFLDCPPKSRPLLRMALIAARRLIIPIRLDENSSKGIIKLTNSVAEIRAENPGFELLGVLRFDFDRQSKRYQAEAKAVIEEILGEGLTFDAIIGHAPGVSFEEQRRGLSAIRQAQQLENTPKWQFLRQGKRTPLPESARKIAVDYQSLYGEVVERIRTTDPGFAPKHIPTEQS